MEFKTIEKIGEGIILEKKSKFIGKAFYIENSKQAEEIIEKVKKEHYDARHNCYAYRILEGNCILERQSDDGEPARNSRKSNA
ncbi:MAG: YigZ family protein [Clostridia bacterium]|nr:YigZ family protein [Clostridia bacterium]